MTRFTSCKARYTACQSDVINKAVQTAATYVPVLRRIAHIIGKIEAFVLFFIRAVVYGEDGLFSCRY